MAASPKQRMMLTSGTFLAGQIFMALNHEGGVGFILATAAGYAAWRFADEVFEKVNDGETSPRQAGTKKHGLLYKLLVNRANRVSDGPTEEEIAEYMQKHDLAPDDQPNPDNFPFNLDDLELEEDILTFKQLLEAGVIQAALKRGEFCLGYIGNELQFIPFKQLGSWAIGGVGGFGKTTTARFLLFQFALMGASLVMVDRHMHEPEESLAAQFTGFTNIHALPPCDGNTKDVEQRILKLTKEYRRREARGIKGPPIIFVIDEFNELMRDLPDPVKRQLRDLLLNLSQGGRKFGMYALLIGQRWSDQDLGGGTIGASIRSSLHGAFAHRFTDVEQAKKLIGPTDGKRCLSLHTGHYLYRVADVPLEIYTPDTKSEDAKLVHQILERQRQQRETSPKQPETARNEERNGLNLSPETGRNEIEMARNERPGEERNGTNPALQAKALAVMAYYETHEEVNQTDCIKEVWGAKPGDNDAWKQARREFILVQRLITEFARQGIHPEEE